MRKLSIPPPPTPLHRPSHVLRAQLEGPEAYHVLSDSGCMTLEGVDDAAQFQEVRKACGTIGMDEATQNQVRECRCVSVPREQRTLEIRAGRAG